MPPKKLSANAQRQVELTAMAERTFYAAAHKHYSVVVAATHEPVTSAETLPPGTEIIVTWRDPRPDAQVWKPVGASSGTKRCRYIDGPTLAHELHASAMGLHDHERKAHRGLWLYTSMDVEPSFFWSMILNFHTIPGGLCLPPLPAKFRGDSNVADVITDGNGSVYQQEMMGLLESLKGGASSLGGPSRGIRLASKFSGVVANFQHISECAQTGKDPSDDEKRFPEPATNVSDPKLLPLWHKRHEDHWGSALKQYLMGGLPPCLWILKVGDGLVGCQAGAQCKADHDGPRRTAKAIEEVGKKPVGLQDNPNDVSAVLMANGVACSFAGCPKHGALVEEGTLKRCSRCHNTMYCDASCQKADWAAHKADCRAPNTDVRETGNVWAMVMPASGRRPYAVLLPVERASKYASEMLDGPVAVAQAQRGEHIDGVMLAFRIDPACTSKEVIEREGRAIPDQRLEVNVRASGILTALDFRDAQDKVKPLGPNTCVVSGRGARCRGTAIAFRVASSEMKAMIDFGIDDYNNRWGLFATIGIGEKPMKDANGDECASVVIMPRTPEAVESLTKAMSGRAKASDFM